MRTFCILVAIILTSATSPAQTKRLGAAADEEAIRNNIDRYVEAWNKADVKAIAAFYTSDGDYFGSLEGRLVKGPAAIEKYHLDAFAGRFKGATKVTSTITSIRFLKPDVALIESNFEITGMRGPDSKELPGVKGLSTAVEVKQDGRWQIAAARMMILPPVQRQTHGVATVRHVGGLRNLVADLWVNQRQVHIAAGDGERLPCHKHSRSWENTACDRVTQSRVPEHRTFVVEVADRRETNVQCLDRRIDTFDDSIG